MTVADLVVLSEEVNHNLSWLIGGFALLVLLALVAGLAAFGAGRDHS